MHKEVTTAHFCGPLSPPYRALLEFSMGWVAGGTSDRVEEACRGRN